MKCKYSKVCSGCPWIEKDYASQLALKEMEFRSSWEQEGLLSQYEFGGVASIGESGLRDRADLIYEKVGERFALGFIRSRLEENSDVGSEIGLPVIDIEECPQMSRELKIGFQKLREKMPAINRRGSVRIRVSPEGKFGVWLDFANLDVKKLLEESTWLDWLSGWASVEIGQRRKKLVRKDDQWKLGEQNLEVWFETYCRREGEGKAPSDEKDQTWAPVPLWGTIGGFSQPGMRLNRRLIEIVIARVRRISVKNWVELFCGNGNFTLPLAREADSVVAVEIEGSAVEGLQRAMGQMKSKIEVLRLDARTTDTTLAKLLDNQEGLLVDPPRSGLGKLTQLISDLPRERRPQSLIYVSCFLDSLLKDARNLEAAGYRAEFAMGLDQFPQTPHCEWIVSFQQSSEINGSEIP